LAQARLELAERRQKVEVLDRGLGEMARRSQQLGELLAQRQQEIETWTDQVASLATESDAQRARSVQLAETLVVTQEQVEKIRVELMAVEREISGLESAQQALRSDAEGAIAALAKHDIKLAGDRQRAQFIAEEVSREFQANISQLDWRHFYWHADGEPEGMKPLDLDEEDEADDSWWTDSKPSP
jgi:chromosome segregation protein